MTEADDTKRNDGGQAFPRTPTDLYDGHAGMTLRQWYMGQAMVGLIANPNNGGTPAQVAKICAAVADAMLDEDDK